MRWLNETGNLPAFYRAVRDGPEARKALAAAFPGTAVSDVDRQLRAWIGGHDPAALIERAAQDR